MKVASALPRALMMVASASASASVMILDFIALAGASSSARLSISIRSACAFAASAKAFASSSSTRARDSRSRDSPSSYASAWVTCRVAFDVAIRPVASFSASTACAPTAQVSFMQPKAETAGQTVRTVASMAAIRSRCIWSDSLMPMSFAATCCATSVSRSLSASATPEAPLRRSIASATRAFSMDSAAAFLPWASILPEASLMSVMFTLISCRPILSVQTQSQNQTV